MELATTVLEQIGKRVRDEPISNRLVSFADPHARPVRKGKLAKPTQFGYVSQLAELTGSTRRLPRIRLTALRWAASGSQSRSVGAQPGSLVMSRS